MNELPDYVLDQLAEIATADGMTDYIIELCVGSQRGDNFIAIINRVTLRGHRNGTPAELRLVIKLSSPCVVKRKVLQMDALFKREVLMYTKILPMLETFQCDRGLTGAKGFTSFPKCYAAVADEQKEQFVVIMEDLDSMHFGMLQKQQPIDNDHIFNAVGKLAQLHVISFAIKDQQPEVYEELRGVTDLFRNFFVCGGLKYILESSFDRVIAVLENESHIEWLQDVRENAHDLIADVLADNASDPFGVICHGDLWINNIFFRYDDEEVNRKSCDWARDDA